MRAWLLATLLSLSVTPALALDGGRYGEVRVVQPTGTMRGYVVLFSDRGGWTAADQAALEALGRAGALAVGVNSDAYLSRIAQATGTCDQLVGDAEGLSRQLQHEQPGAAEYQFPILTGIGYGGTLAWVTLSQAPVNTLSGAVSVDPVVALPGHRPLCPGPVATPDEAGGFVYGPIASLSGFWTDGTSAAAPAERHDHIAALQAAGTPVDLVPVEDAPEDGLAQLVEPHLGQTGDGGVAALPLIELPAASPSPLLAVVISGDGGWRDLDKTIAEDLQQDGVSVVGWDSVRYFWHEKTPDQTAADLAAVLETYLARYHADKVALVGYSFGADVMPFLYNRLPEALRRRVVLMSLLGFEGKADWQITVSGWLGAPPSDDATPVAPALATVPRALLQCFYGVEEGDSDCPTLVGSGAEIIKTSGGHHFDGDYHALEQRILTALRRRAGLSKSPE